MKTKKHTIIPTLSLCLAALFFSNSTMAGHDHYSQFKLTESEQINNTMRFESSQTDNKITIYNVYGSIEVIGHEGDDIEILANNTVYANDQAHLQQGIDEIGLKQLHIDNNIYIYLDSPFTHFEEDSRDIWHSDTCITRYDCSKKYTEKKQYKYNMDITVKIPQNPSNKYSDNKHSDNKVSGIKVSAINNGDILVKNIDAENLNVSNINGAIHMDNVSGQTRAHAINKDINITYKKNPNSASSFESINGDLNIQFSETPNAKVIYKTMNGDMYTKYEYTSLPVEVEKSKPNKNSKHKKHGNKYRIAANHPIQIGEGGPTYTFKTLNGDIEIK